MGKPSRFAEIDAELSAIVAGCKLCHFMNTAPPEDAAYIDGLLRQPSAVKGHAYIVRVLERGDVEVSDSGVKRHRLKHLSP